MAFYVGRRSSQRSSSVNAMWVQAFLDSFKRLVALKQIEFYAIQGIEGSKKKFALMMKYGRRACSQVGAGGATPPPRLDIVLLVKQIVEYDYQK